VLNSKPIKILYIIFYIIHKYIYIYIYIHTHTHTHTDIYINNIPSLLLGIAEKLWKDTMPSICDVKVLKPVLPHLLGYAPGWAVVRKGGGRSGPGWGWGRRG